MESKLDSQIPSDSLASLVVDALVDAGLVSKQNFETAVQIATSEIDARKHLGDYWCHNCQIGPNKTPFNPSPCA
jgi:hypothetical protein